MRRIPQLSPEPLKIHRLLAFQTVWTDDIWIEVLNYLLASVSDSEALQMTTVLGDSIEFDDSFFKMDYLKEFRPFPPSAILAAFDLIRLNRL